MVYDQATHTSRLFFAGDINNLPGVPQGGGTWRLRIGTAVDNRVDLILPPTQVAVTPSSVSDFQYDGLRVTFFAKTTGEVGNGRQISFINSGSGGLVASLDTNGNVIFDFGGVTPTFRNLQSAITAVTEVSDVIGMNIERNGVAGDGIDLTVPSSVIGAPALQLYAVGETLDTALDIGILGQNNQLTSLVFSESIDPQAFLIELPGGNDDPGRLNLPEVDGGGLIQYINDAFGLRGADIQPGVTDIAYNFQDVYAVGASDNQINDRQKDRIREALNLWSSQIGVQFRETVDSGITFALGDISRLANLPNTTRRTFGVLNASVRIDPTFTNSAMVFSNQTDFNTAYGEDFLRKATAGIGLLLGLEQSPGLPPQTLMAFSPTFLNADINVLNDLEPVFPGNYDILHGQYLHRPDSVDVDLYRFEVDLNDENRLGTFTAETFAERLPDSSSLDTTLSLFREVGASASSDFGVGSSLGVLFESLLPGKLGNNTTVEFLRSDRGPGDTAVRVSQKLDRDGRPIQNGMIVDIPRRGSAIASVQVGAVVDAINNNPFASRLLRASVVIGSGTTDISDAQLNIRNVSLGGGGLEQLSRNDDYFSEDSRIIAQLGGGTYYVGVAASGNDSYDPTIAGSGYGGLTQGKYDLHLKFEPQVDEVDVIRDLDSSRADVPGTSIDGDGDGVPGGVNNFWFQTRPLNRTLSFTGNGSAITPGQTITVTGANSVVRRFEFVEIGGNASPGNIPVFFSTGSGSTPSPAGNLAGSLLAAINSRQSETGVTVSQQGTTLEFRGEQEIEFSNDFRGTVVFGRNIFVDKTAGPQADGSLVKPFNNIANPVVANAFDASLSNDIVRIIGNGGQDGNLATEADNFSYKVGVSETGGLTLEDGRNLEVPKGVTMMVDAGAIIKLRNARIGVGSSTLLEDRSGGALQVLGTPRLVGLSASGETVATTLAGDEDSTSPGYSDGSVILTSINDVGADSATVGVGRSAEPGDWGGVVFRRDLDESEGRKDAEDEGIFLQTVNHAQIRYGGGSNVLIDSIQQLVNPIQVFDLRPTITFNEIAFQC